MEKKKKGKKGVVAGAAGGALAAVLLLGGGLGLGGGMGEGSISAMNQAVATDPMPEITPAPELTPAPTPTPVPEAKTIRIEARQDQYFVDGAEATLSEIESLILGGAGENTSFALEDHYASAKAWDELKALFIRHEVAVTEG